MSKTPKKAVHVTPMPSPSPEMVAKQMALARFRAECVERAIPHERARVEREQAAAAAKGEK